MWDLAAKRVDPYGLLLLEEGVLLRCPWEGLDVLVW